MLLKATMIAGTLLYAASALAQNQQSQGSPTAPNGTPTAPSTATSSNTGTPAMSPGATVPGVASSATKDEQKATTQNPNGTPGTTK